MKSKLMKSLKEEYEEIVQKYVDVFSLKQEMELEFWVADRPGEIACFGDYYIGFSELKYDIDNNVPEGTFLEYYDYILKNMDNNELRKLSYENYVKGFRFENDKKM